MTETINCKLYVIGNNSVGKTTLINRIINRQKPYLENTEGLRQLDWNIKDHNSLVSVNIQERPFINEELDKSIHSKNFDNSVIIIALDSNSQKNTLFDEYWETVLRAIPDNSIVLVFVNLKENSNTSIININALRKKYPNIRDLFVVDSLKSEKADSIKAFRLYLKQLILNAYTSRLDTVKEKIKWNLQFKRKVLDLGKCSLTNLIEVKELFNNTHLETLIISNEWAVNEDNSWVRKTSDNDGNDNIFASLPEEIKKLENLKVLVCGGNWKGSDYLWQIKDIEFLSHLKKLSVLNVSNNKLTQFNGLSNLLKLNLIYFNNNEINSLPNISNLQEVRELILSNNKLESLLFLKGLNTISTLDLHSNLIKDLNPIKELISKLDIQDTKWKISSISIANNPLIVPTPEVISQGKEKILAYFKQYEAEQKIKLSSYTNRDIKLILVGNSNAGKSSLVNTLKGVALDKNIASTHWMIVDDWTARRNNEKYKIRIFDFGGQEYYHDTHHLFFTNKTAYVVLWEDKSNLHGEIKINQTQLDGKVKSTNVQTFPLEYWLDSIDFHLNKRLKSESEKGVTKLLKERSIQEKALNKESHEFDASIFTEEDSNVLIVQNKVDLLDKKSFLNQKDLKSSNNRIFDFASISVHKKEGIEHFKDLLFEIFNSIPIVGEEYLGTWGKIKEKIEGKDFKKSMQLEDFTIFCNNIISNLPELDNKSNTRKKEVYFDQQDTESFAQYLNDIGILLYFPENRKLKNSVFINQKQILKNIYNILLGLKSTKGEFNYHEISIAHNSNNNEVKDIVTLMLHFKIIFEHPSKKDTFIAPLYLPNEPMNGLKIFISLFNKPIYRFEYKKFIHKNVILDFFSHYGKHALKDTNNENLYYYWRDGIIINNPPSDEIIMVKFYSCNENGQKSHIDIFRISESNSNELLNKVIADLDRINSDWGTVKSVTINGDDFVPLSIIHENEKNENWTFQYDEKYFKLLDFAYYLKNKIKMKKIFISYSKQDLVLVNKFIEHLSALKIDGLVSDWYCTELTAGSDWDNEIQANFDDSDIVCFMISPNFMKTKYIHDHEIDKAFKKKELKQDDFTIIPIILDFCRWSTTKNNLSQYTALPYTAKPVVDFQNQNMAWYIIQECIRSVIVDKLNPMKDDYYLQKLPKDVLSIYERIVENKVNI